MQNEPQRFHGNPHVGIIHINRRQFASFHNLFINWLVSICADHIHLIASSWSIFWFGFIWFALIQCEISAFSFAFDCFSKNIETIIFVDCSLSWVTNFFLTTMKMGCIVPFNVWNMIQLANDKLLNGANANVNSIKFSSSRECIDWNVTI